jgi:Cephalosporin hydroxylase
MKIVIDTDNKKCIIDKKGNIEEFDLYSKDAFEIISEQWVKVGWNEKYEYTFSWFGRPIIQLPEDMIRMQEVIYSVKPDIIIETGVAHGGSLIYYASLCKAMGKGRVVGIDIEIRPHNRKSIEEHELSNLITLIEGNSVEETTINKVRENVKKDEVVLVILDSCHRKEHVYKELELYSQFVSTGSYIIATDGIMKELHDVPRGEQDWLNDNPSAAAIEFTSKNDSFQLENPKWNFNESNLNKNITHWPNAWIKREK